MDEYGEEEEWDSLLPLIVWLGDLGLIVLLNQGNNNINLGYQIEIECTMYLIHKKIFVCRPKQH